MPQQRPHVLVVDDLVDTAESTADLLSLWGYDVAACYGGAAALACARLRPPAAVLLDLVMPRMDGFEFARLFRQSSGCGAVPLIAVSGYAGAGHAARAQLAGIGHYLLKPAEPEQLRSLLVAVTRRAARDRRVRKWGVGPTLFAAAGQV
jgi:two-component system CheB/CheR fusion protein